MAERWRLIALSGPRGCGKSTAAGMLEKRGYRRLAFADPIRAAVLELFPLWDRAQFEPPLKDGVCPVYGISPRAALRAFGEHARSLDPLIYVRAMDRRVGMAQLIGGRGVVIDDLRMPDEADWVRSLGGSVVHVRRPGCDWSGEHVTEQGPGWEPGDLALPNPAGLEHLAAMVRLLVGGCHGHA